MQTNYDNELSEETREKMKKNLVYLGIFSIIMLFAGLTSAYIVSMGDSFWVKFNFPQAFYISTAIILTSSLVLELGNRAAKKGKTNVPKITVSLTFILGLLFVVFQWKGYKQLVESGAYFNSHILVTEGRYGSYYELKVDGQFMEVNGNDYLLAGKKMNESQKKEISVFAKQFEGVYKSKPTQFNGLNKITILYKGSPIAFEGGKFITSDSTALKYVDLRRMSEFMWHLRDGRGDFYIKGQYGKDFNIYYKGKALSYTDRALHYKGVKLSAPMQMDAEGSADVATSYLYIITFLHLLHVIVTLIYMLRMTIRSFTGRLEFNNYISIRMGAIFWHFLGVLWVYLLLFLLFIH